MSVKWFTRMRHSVIPELISQTNYKPIGWLGNSLVVQALIASSIPHSHYRRWSMPGWVGSGTEATLHGGLGLGLRLHWWVRSGTEATLVGGAWDREHTGGWGLGPDRVGPGTKTTLMGLGLGRTDTTLEGWAWDWDYTTPYQSIVTTTQDQNYVFIIVCDQSPLLVSSQLRSWRLPRTDWQWREKRDTAWSGQLMVRGTESNSIGITQYWHDTNTLVSIC